MANLSGQDGMRDAAATAAAAAAAAVAAQVPPDPRLDPGAEVWVHAHDPRCHRVKLLESQGELAAAAQLLRLVLAEMDPRAQRPKLHKYLPHLTGRMEQRSAAQPVERNAQGSASAAAAQPHAAVPAEPGDGSTAMSSVGLVRTLSCRERSRKQSAEAEVELHARKNGVCEGS
eukprot:SAG22_NODE_1237_length_5050_cov_1.625404_5_plen_173_part_00